MKYVSIDIETSGLNPETCQILEFAAVIDDTDKIGRLADLPRFHVRFKLNDPFVGEPYALNLNKTLIEKIKLKDESECRIIDTHELCFQLTNFLELNNFKYSEDPNCAAVRKITETVVPAGKNFLGFDKKFLDKIGAFTLIKLSHRAIDPSVLYWMPHDTNLPSSETCYSRAGFKEEVKHTALEDAIGIIKLLRNGWNLPALEE